MKKQITHVSVHQTSKVLSILYFLLSAIFLIPLGIYTIFMRTASESLLFFLLPFIYMIVCYIMTAILAYLYNAIASSFGGIEFTISDVSDKEELK